MVRDFSRQLHAFGSFCSLHSNIKYNFTFTRPYLAIDSYGAERRHNNFESSVNLERGTFWWIEMFSCTNALSFCYETGHTRCQKYENLSHKTLFSEANSRNPWNGIICLAISGYDIRNARTGNQKCLCSSITWSSRWCRTTLGLSNEVIHFASLSCQLVRFHFNDNSFILSKLQVTAKPLKLSSELPRACHQQIITHKEFRWLHGKFDVCRVLE